MSKKAQKPTEIKPDYVEAQFRLGMVYSLKGEDEEAAECFKKCLELQPEFHDALYNLGVIYQKQNNLQEAISCYKNAIQLRSDFEKSYFSLGSIYEKQGIQDRAIYCFKKAIELKPDFFIAYNSMGIVYQKMKRFEKAMSCYRSALAIKPDYEAAYVNMGNLYFDLNLCNKAIENYDCSLKINPDNAFTHFNMANSLCAMGKKSEAKEKYRTALDLNPDMEKACAGLVERMQHDCEWGGLEQLSEKLDNMTKNAINRGVMPMENPFLNISRHDDPELNHAVAGFWSRKDNRKSFKVQRNDSDSYENRKKRKIRLGYISNNYRNHPNAQLTIDMFEKHDPKDFDVFCYSYGKNDGSAYRKKIERTCDQFLDLKNHNDIEAAKKIYQDEVDILIDLVGQTEGNRMGICSARPAPVQVRYLGMAGTTGADFFDYIITDQTVTPENQGKYYSEKFVYMPHCYQVNSEKQERMDMKVSRGDIGLPEKSIVFCCFSTSYKIDPIMFGVWMNILKQIPESVLWLLKQGDDVERNLKKEAGDRGINEKRLIFSFKLPIEEHLIRLKLADLALDTRIVNGAATTSDALWAGVPVVTLQGNHFASRMSSSILSAVGAQELVTENLIAYEEKAVFLVSDRDRLNQIKEKLRENKKIMPLFDTTRFVRDIETGYKMMFEKYWQGKSPVHIRI